MLLIAGDQFWRINESFHDLMGTGNIVLQLVILGMLVIGIRFKRRGDIVSHGNMMLLAAIANFISVSLVMLTGFIWLYVSETDSLSYKFSLLHGTVGGLAMILSFWLIVPWVARGTNLKICTRKRTLMRMTYALWVLALFMGIVEYSLDVVFRI